jgi:hypothetical protein
MAWRRCGPGCAVAGRSRTRYSWRFPAARRSVLSLSAYATKIGRSLVRAKAAVKLFDPQDGNGVDWRMMAEILFFAAFDALDRLPDDQRHRIAKSVESGAFKRYSAADADEFAANRTGQGRAVAPPSNAADFTPSEPGPGKLP